MDNKYGDLVARLFLFLRWRKEVSPPESKVEYLEVGISEDAEASIWGHTRGVLALVYGPHIKDEEKAIRKEINKIKGIAINNLLAFKEEAAASKILCGEVLGRWPVWIRDDMFKLIYIYTTREIKELQRTDSFPGIVLELEQRGWGITISAEKIN
jgi:hypothetical protein